MNAQNNNANATRFEDRALSSNELDLVSGGERHQVTLEEWEKIVAQKIADSKVPGICRR